MKRIIIVSFVFFNFIVQAQNIKGKTYVAETGMSCEKHMGGGGCTIINYCCLQFEKKYVNVFYKSTVLCSPQEQQNENSISAIKKYTWKKNDKTITINGFNNYGVLKIEDGKLIGTKEMNYKEYKSLEFKEETCLKK